jgi:hypothetical protein
LLKPPNDDVDELGGAEKCVFEDAVAGGSAFGVVEGGAPKLNPENGVLTVLPASLAVLGTLAAGAGVEIDKGTVSVLGVGAVVAGGAPKLNPENALGAVASEADFVAGAPKLNAGVAVAGVEDAGAVTLFPNKLVVGAALPNPANVDVLDEADPKADVGGAAAGTTAYGKLSVSNTALK